MEDCPKNLLSRGKETTVLFNIVPEVTLRKSGIRTEVWKKVAKKNERRRLSVQSVVLSTVSIYTIACYVLKIMFTGMG